MYRQLEALNLVESLKKKKLTDQEETIGQMGDRRQMEGCSDKTARKTKYQRHNTKRGWKLEMKFGLVDGNLTRRQSDKS